MTRKQQHRIADMVEAGITWTLCLVVGLMAIVMLCVLDAHGMTPQQFRMYLQAAQQAPAEAVSRPWVYPWDPSSNNCMAVYDWVSNSTSYAWDASGLGNHATRISGSAPAFKSAYNSISAMIDNNGYLYYRTPINPTGWTSITLVCWSKGAISWASGGYENWLGSRTSATTTNGLVIEPLDSWYNAPYYRISARLICAASGYAQASTPSQAYSPHTWTMIGITWGGPGKSLNLYVNLNVYTSNPTSMTQIDTRTNFFLMTQDSAGTRAARSILLDSVRVYDTELSDAQMRNLFWRTATTNSPIDSGGSSGGHGYVMLDYYRQAEWSNTVLVSNSESTNYTSSSVIGFQLENLSYRNSGSTNNLYATSGASYPSGGSDGTNGWVYFDNGDFYSNGVSLASGMMYLDGTNQSVSAWLWLSSTSDIGTVWSYGDGTREGCQLVQTNGLLRFEGWTNNLGTNIEAWAIQTANIVAPSQWVWVASTWSGAVGQVALWTNDAIVGTSTWAFVPQKKWCVGSNSNQLWMYYGRMDEFRVSSDAYTGEYITNGVYGMTRQYHP